MVNRKTVFSTVIVLFLAVTPVFSSDFCFDEAGSMYGISPDLLRIISDEESGGNPSAINYNRNGTYDFCHMQMNSSWAPVIGLQNWMTLGNPCQCTKWGAWVLAGCIQRYGYTWQAVGCYNATSEPKRLKYAWKIYTALMKQGRGQIAKVPCTAQTCAKLD